MAQTPLVHQISVETVKNGIGESYATLKDLQKRLQQISMSESSTIRRMRWVQHKSSLEEIDDRIKGQCAMLHSLVSLAQMEMMLAMCSQNPQLLKICSSIAGEMARDTVNRQDLPLLLTPTEPAPTVDSRPAAYREETMRALGGNSVALVNLLDGSFPAPGVWNKRQQNSSSTGSSIGSSGASPATSIFSSLNKCHKQSIKVSKGLFSKFNSPIFKQSKGSRIECSEPDCAGATSSQTRVLPSAFFRRVFPRLASMQGVRVRYNLNTYRMVPEGSDAIRYVKHGNLDKLKMCISSREATPWDTAPDGWSLLHVDLSSYLFTNSNANISRPPSMQGNYRP
ncbi:hypothetical protein CFD26_107856 [Aspergillus turcosus]|uniref:Uncharacterized protein n=1 Tax=Aspergillus turcosus TaxID=1245748 RepID=A0A3R7JK74_9EURO|nr:hypothetical protein CFD26_107856 [Aspergillus turcosus]